MVFAFYEKNLVGNAGTLYKCLSRTNYSILVVHFFCEKGLTFRYLGRLHSHVYTVKGRGGGGGGGGKAC